METNELLGLTEISQRLSDKNLKIVAERTEIPYHRLYRLKSGQARRPLIEDINKLTDYLNNN